jgi:tetratricopeptide (TPR) repeat protein
MAVEADYYEILGVARSAPDPEIREAHKRESRVWRKRVDVASADLSTRQEAELRMKWLQDAFDILLDPQRRGAYDRELAAAPPARDTQSAQRGAGGWLQQARDYLGRGDYASAVYAAREATRESGASAEGWVILSRGNAGLRRFEDAIYEGQQAVLLEPANADYHFSLGCVAEELGRWDQAIGEYHVAAQRDPSQPIYQLSIGGVLLQNDQPDQALRVIEEVYTRAPDDEVANYYLAQVLIKLAERVPRRQTQDSYVVTTAREVQAMRVHMDRAKLLKPNDGPTEAAIDYLVTYLDRMESKRFHVPAGFLFVGMLVGSEGSCTATMLGGAVVVALFLLPVILLLSGLSAMGSGSPGGGLVVILIGLAICYLWFRLMWVPNWKVNARRA